MTTTVNASNVERFMNNIPSITSDIVDIDNIISAGGDLSVIVGVDVIVKALTRLMLINNRTYLFNPTFGVGLPRYLFEPSDIGTQSTIINAVKTEVAKYETRAQVIPNIIFTDNYNGFILSLKITYMGTTKTANIQVNKDLLQAINNFDTNVVTNSMKRIT